MLPLSYCVRICVLVATAVAVEFEAFSTEGQEFTHYRPGRAKRAFKDTTKRQLTQADRIQFLNKHNNFRRMVDPTAADMPFMRWNDTLEYYAQRWALNCEFKHGYHDDLLPRQGQNLWMGSGGYDNEGTVNAWHSEVQYYNLADHTCTKVCGHYTQVVWKSSVEVGCGVAYCESVPNKSNPQWIAVCNYLKAGNYVGKRPYVAGESCSSCPEGFPTCDDKLCRRDPLCGDLKCENGETMDTTTCLCECGNQIKGPWCGAHPLGELADTGEEPPAPVATTTEPPPDYYDYHNDYYLSYGDENSGSDGTGTESTDAPLDSNEGSGPGDIGTESPDAPLDSDESSGSDGTGTENPDAPVDSNESSGSDGTGTESPDAPLDSDEDSGPGDISTESPDAPLDSDEDSGSDGIGTESPDVPLDSDEGSGSDDKGSESTDAPLDNDEGSGSDEIDYSKTEEDEKSSTACVRASVNLLLFLVNLIIIQHA